MGLVIGIIGSDFDFLIPLPLLMRVGVRLEAISIEETHAAMNRHFETENQVPDFLIVQVDEYPYSSRAAKVLANFGNLCPILVLLPPNAYDDVNLWEVAKRLPNCKVASSGEYTTELEELLRETVQAVVN
jgi:hypothetical protein